MMDDLGAQAHPIPSHPRQARGCQSPIPISHLPGSPGTLLMYLVVLRVGEVPMEERRDAGTIHLVERGTTRTGSHTSTWPVSTKLPSQRNKLEPFHTAHLPICSFIPPSPGFIL